MDRNALVAVVGNLVVQSLSARRAWIEMQGARDDAGGIRSLSARRAWIEIGLVYCGGCGGTVALRKESVDRNWLVMLPLSSSSMVALRKESVDRNLKIFEKY